MYPIWLLCLSSFKNKKTQNGFIALIMMLSTLLLSTAVLVINNTGSIYLDMHDKVKGAHQLIQLENGLHHPEEIKQWWQQQENVTTSELMRYRTLTGISHNEKEISNFYAYMMDTPDAPFSVDQLIFAKGSESQDPVPGTVWIPTALAYTQNISIGDPLIFSTEKGTFQLKVAAIVVDISYCSPFATSGRIWMNHTDFQQHFTNMQGTDMYMMGLRFDDYSENREYWESLEETLRSPYLESITDFEGISSYYMITNKMIGFIMIFLAVIMIGIAIFTLGFTISDTILSNYKTIGILQSIGFPSRYITIVYTIQYTLLAFTAVIPGISISYFLSNKIVKSSLSFLNTNSTEMQIHFFQTALITGLMMVLLIGGTSFLLSYKTRFIKPAQAIRSGMTEKNNAKGRQKQTPKNRIIRFERFPFPFMISLRDIRRNNQSSLLIVLLSTMTTAVLVFGFIFVFSIFSIKETISLWGYDAADLSLRIDNPSTLSYQDLEKQVLLDKRVKNYSRFGELNGVIPIDDHDLKKGTTNVLIMAVEGNYDDIGYVNLEGRNPQSNDEIAIGINIAKSLNKKVGDPVIVYMKGQQLQFTVTGIYQAIANMAYTARISSDAVLKIDPSYNDMEDIFLNVHENISPESFIKELKEKYGHSIWAATQRTLVDEVFSQATAILIMPITVMGLLFVIVTLVIIYSICRIQIKKESRTYGIYQSIGVTIFKAKMSIALKIFILSMIGVIVGVPIGLFGLPLILPFILADYGIVKIPLILHWSGVTAAVVCSVLAAVIGAWIASNIVKTTTPRMLTID
ncbi:ABC transporter permease [Bacillus chungangensis]|uniref:ABC transport system permease protein n=1 Tax=Bacillus chungangensis TaxID=587633 RepID=A0ABT9WT51_9BACI|nr:FtsX-like permease family protein [Bacillus chungangensis]MDQ0176087.1 putative ABC transport system permease protein [Bacillus chungangensis]